MRVIRSTRPLGSGPQQVSADRMTEHPNVRFVAIVEQFALQFCPTASTVPFVARRSHIQCPVGARKGKSQMYFSSVEEDGLRPARGDHVDLCVWRQLRHKRLLWPSKVMACAADRWIEGNTRIAVGVRSGKLSRREPPLATTLLWKSARTDYRYEAPRRNQREVRRQLQGAPSLRTATPVTDA